MEPEPNRLAPDAPATPASMASAASTPTAPAAEADALESPRLAERIIDAVKTVLTALVLAFIFRAFLVEAFVIPTGSMAEGLVGAHLTHVCRSCGWEFDLGVARGTARGLALPGEALCPNCHRRDPIDAGHAAIRDGDRLLVHKWPFALGGVFAPQRWDVIVFRDPADPQQNYIKRLVGLPGETVEILAGDVFINGRIATKTPAAQSALWIVVYDQSHAPAPTPWGDAGPWSPDESESAPGWRDLDTRVIRFDAADDAARTLRFNRYGASLYETDTSGYNQGPSSGQNRDLRLRADVSLGGGPGGVRFDLLRPERRFSLELDTHGRLALRSAPSDAGESRVLAEMSVARTAPFEFAIEFGHVDYRVYVRVNDREIFATTPDLYAPPLEALRSGGVDAPTGVAIVARGAAIELRHLRIDRDVYYTFTPRATLRAYAGSPFTLGSDEYFVLGDNSPASHDSREWYQRGPHMPSGYRAGTVRADQIVGRAFFVYLPGLNPLDGAGRWRLPDLGRVRFVR
ncbi:MAG: signal peptidase I [Phycisphaerae bacterium]